MIPVGSLVNLTVRTKTLLTSTPTRRDMAVVVFTGIFLTLLAVAQVVRAVPVSGNDGRLDTGALDTIVGDHARTAPAETIPESPCIHHDLGTQCAPCAYCSAPTTELSELLELVSVDIGNQDPPGVKQHFPATVLKPPR